MICVAWKANFPLDWTLRYFRSIRYALLGKEKRSEREHITPFITDRPSLFESGV